ncbi:MAG TPA: phosphodiester glycosidase family protein, partial [Gaiellaceae bacterium]|nr:phosphodiester glycosidase family protein [Gaiellaceae bacterium]
MVRRAVICTLFAGLFVAPGAFAAVPVRGQTLLPGVTYSRQVEFTGHGPVVINVISAPKPTGLYALKPILSNEAILGRERVTSMQKRVSAQATVAGVNGDLFSFKDGHPTGGLIRGGILDSAPVDFRSTIGIDTDGVLHVDRVRLAGTWQGSGQRRILGINEVPQPNRTTLYTRAWGARTPAENGGAQAIIEPFPATKPNTPLTGVVTQYVSGGNQPIPADGAVLVARGSQAGFLSAEAPIGATVTVLLTLTPPWTNVSEAVGGGPIIVRDGKPVFRSLEGFTTDQLAYRHPRTGVGQTADGHILLVAVDGRQPGYSTGLTNFELALTMMRLGCVTASALDAGGSTTMAFDGKLLNRPSDPGGERPVAEALTLFYYGVYAPALPARVLSPNADGVDDTQTFSYKLVRPSTVTATLTGPGGIAIPLDSGSRAPGTYKFDWTGVGQPEGNWTFRAVADDDLGRHSVADRQFALNDTLGFVVASASHRRVTGTFKLAEPARVALRVETPGGGIVKTLATRSLAAGSGAISWRGRPGSYVFSVTATNEVGAVELTTPFRLRR